MRIRLLSLMILCAVFAGVFSGTLSAQVQAGDEYYLYNIYYDRVLGQKADASPGLSKIGVNTDNNSYIFVVESSATEGYFYLKQKSSGKYLAASTSNTWSVVFQSSKGATNHYLWSFSAGMETSIVCRQTSTKMLGCDTGKEADTYVSVFYDKSNNELSRWQVIKADTSFNDARKQLYINALGQTIEKSQGVVSQTIYDANLRQQLSGKLATAEGIYENAAGQTLTTIIQTHTDLQNALGNCLASSMVNLLSGKNFDVENAFTLALNQLDFSIDTEISLIIRNARGQGAVVDIATDKISVNGQLLQDDLPKQTEAMDYQFAFNGSSVSVYRDGTLAGSASMSSVPAYTQHGTAAEWSLLGVGALSSYLPEVISATKAVVQGTPVTDKYGKNVRYAVFLENQSINLSTAVDFHILREETPLKNTTINLTHEDAWVIFDNTLPSVVISNYLSSIKINGVNAVNNNNVRVGIYLNGAVLIPHKATYQPFTGYSEENLGGTQTSLRPGANELGKASNTFRSFVLKRGYMATLASGSNGSGYSRVYVADHKDIVINVLPQALNRRISSVHIKKWNYVSKKGWCDTKSNAAIAGDVKKMRATWFYTWSADRGTTADAEYIPTKQHLYWPSDSQVNGHANSTHMLSINEPEHAEQHTSDKCSCGGVISPWTCCTITPNFQPSGMRIGSPSPTDASWLTTYINHCNDMAYRCDFVVIHAYWGTNEAANAQAWYNRLKAIYDATKRPIWITEWNNGASWTTESWPSNYGDRLEKNKNAIREILNVLDTCRFVERYAIYNWDSYYRAMIADDGWVTPAGEVYRDNKSTFAYNADVQFTPVWWTPGLKAVTLKTTINSASGKIIFTVKNDNGDMTDQMIIQRKKQDGTFENIYSETDRSVYDKTTHTYSFDMADFDVENDVFRLYVKTVVGAETTSDDTDLAYINNPNITTGSKDAVEGWTCVRSAANGYTKGTGDTYFEVWDSNAAGMAFNYYQDINDLAEGVYELSAACFNSTNGVAADFVNGNVGLYAQADGVEYFAPVTTDSELDLQNRQTIPLIAVKNGTLRIGIKNIGPMTARWAGADEFNLRFLGSFSSILSEGYEAFRQNMRKESDDRYKALFTWNQDKTQADASVLILNPDCFRKDSYGWTVNTVDYKSGEAYDGVSSNYYWDKWSSSAYTSGMYQDIAFLPAGTYTPAVLLRCSSGAQMEFYSSKDGGSTRTSVYYTGIGNASPAGSPYQNGWEKVTLPPVTIQAGESLRIGMTVSLTNKWWSADHFTLQYEPVQDTGNIYTTNDGLRIRTMPGLAVLEATYPTAIEIFDLLGYSVYRGLIDTETLHLPLPSGLYIINRQKLFIP